MDPTVFPVILTVLTLRFAFAHRAARSRPLYLASGAFHRVRCQRQSAFKAVASRSTGSLSIQINCNRSVTLAESRQRVVRLRTFWSPSPAAAQQYRQTLSRCFGHAFQKVRPNQHTVLRSTPDGVVSSTTWPRLNAQPQWVRVTARRSRRSPFPSLSAAIGSAQH